MRRNPCQLVLAYNILGIRIETSIFENREQDRCQDKNTSQKDTRKSLARKLIHDSCKNAARSAVAVILMPIPVESGPGYTRAIKMRMHLFMMPNPLSTLPAT